MVSKSLIHKKIYENINSLNELPPMDVEQIADILVINPRGIPHYVKYEKTTHPVNFRNVMESTRKDLIFHYTDQSRKAIYGVSGEYEGITYGNIIDYEPFERIIKVDHVSFFTKIKENSSEHRIYQIGARYTNKEIYNLEDKIREQKKNQNYKKQIELLHQLINIDPDDFQRYVQFAEIYFQIGNYEKVIEMCKEQLKKDGRSSDAWNLIGQSYHKMNDVKTAIKFYEKSVEEYPGYLKGLKNLAIISYETKEYDYAINYCLKHLENDHTQEKVWSLEILKLIEQIQQTLMKIIVLNQDDTDTRITLGEFYYDTSDFNKALKIFDEVLEIDSTNIDALVYKGLILVEKEEYEDAINIYKKALEIDPQDEIVWDNLGLAYEYNKEQPKSIQAYEKANQLAPNDLEIRQHLTIAHLNAPKTDLHLDDAGKLINEDQVKFYQSHILEYFNKDFITPMKLANREYEDFQIFINIEFPKLISNLEVYYTLESLKSLVLKSIENTNEKIDIILPLAHPEILSYCSEYSYKNKVVNFVLISFWDMEMYGNILSKMSMLGNIQIRQLSAPANSFIILRDETEIILAPSTENLEEITCVRSIDIEFVKFFGNLIPMFAGVSRPIQPQ